MQIPMSRLVILDDSEKSVCRENQLAKLTHALALQLSSSLQLRRMGTVVENLRYISKKNKHPIL